MTNVHFHQYLLLGIWSLQILQEDLLVSLPLFFVFCSNSCYGFYSLGLNFKCPESLAKCKWSSRDLACKLETDQKFYCHRDAFSSHRQFLLCLLCACNLQFDQKFYFRGYAFSTKGLFLLYMLSFAVYFKLKQYS